MKMPNLSSMNIDALNNKHACSNLYVEMEALVCIVEAGSHALDLALKEPYFKVLDGRQLCILGRFSKDEQ